MKLTPYKRTTQNIYSGQVCQEAARLVVPVSAMGGTRSRLQQSEEEYRERERKRVRIVSIR